MAIGSAQRTARRTALVQAAMEVMAEQGVAQSRLADIGARAGISTGQVLYYFESKDDLFVAALLQVEEDLRTQVRAAIAAPAPFARRLDAFLELAAPAGPGDFRLQLWLEAWALASRSPEVAERVQRLEDDWLDLLVEVLEPGRPKGMRQTTLRDAATGLSALMDGLTIQVVIGSPRLDRTAMLDRCRTAVATALAAPR